MHAEEGQFMEPTNTHGEYRGFQVVSPIINSAMRSLAALFRYQGRTEAADIMEEYAMRTRKQGAAVESVKDSSRKRSSSQYSVKYEPGDDGNVEWNGDGFLRRGGSLGKMREVLRRSSEMLVKKLQGTILQDTSNANPNMKRAASLNFLNRSGDDYDSFQRGRRLRESRGLSSSTVELYDNTGK